MHSCFATEYRDEGYLVPKNTSVIARRVPLATTLMANFTAKQEKQAAIRLAAEQQAAHVALDFPISTFYGDKQ